MLERRCRGGRGDRALSFRHYGVTLVAIFADYAAVGADVLAVMAAEASRVIVVPKIVGMRLPVQLHVRESCAAIDLLNLDDRIADLQLLALGYIWVFRLVETLQATRNGGNASSLVLYVAAKTVTASCLMEGKEESMRRASST